VWPAALSLSSREGAQPVSTQDDYLAYADVCRRLAADGDAAAHRTVLERMARAWTKLAKEEERIADFVREVDDLFAGPEGIDDLLRRAGTASH
jgi:hypothetical protein